MSVLDVFNGNAFSVLALTDAVNKVPFVPGRAGTAIGWEEQSVDVTQIMIEEFEGSLTLVNPTKRGGPGASVAKEKRTARIIQVPHYQVDDAIYAEEVQGVRAFGQENALQSLQAKVNSRLADHVRYRLDPTLEHQRVGAVKGIILNGDGSTLLNLFTAFDVTQETELDFDLDAGSPASGALRKKCTEAIRLMATNMGGNPWAGAHAFCGDAFWDDLIAHSEVRNTYLNQQEAAQLRGNVTYGQLSFGGIVWENYRGSVGGTAFVHTDKCHIFPVGSPGLWRTVYAPADYEETVNTNGLPRYARQYAMPNGKGRSLEAQMNALSYCTRPKSLLKGKRT